MPLIEQHVGNILKNLGGLSFEDTTVLVTGGSGFLGSWICDVVLRQNGRVLCLDNFSSGRKENVEHLTNDDKFMLIQHDISNPYQPSEKIDVVLHLASRASPLEFDQFPIQIIKANSLGTLNALGIAKKHGARFLFTSTSEVYGDATVIPTPESYNGNVNTLGIRGCYDESKRVGEAYCMAYLRQHKVDVRIARIFNTYGPRMRADGHYGRVVPRFIEQAMNGRPITIFGNGEQTRSFCYVTDQVAGLLKLAGRNGLTGEVINIGMPVEITILDLAKTIKELLSSDSEVIFEPLPPDDPRRRCPDIQKAENILNWRPEVELNEGLLRMIETEQH